MRELTEKEVRETSGGILNFVLGTAVALGSYFLNKHRSKEPVTVAGVATAASFGAVTGGLGGVAVGAAGGGVVANIAWRPGFIAINAAGQAIASKK